MGRLDGDLRSNPARINNPIQKREADKQTVKPKDENVSPNNAGTLKANRQLYAQQQKERLERLYAAGAGGALALKDVGLMRATNRADKAYDAVYSEGLKSGKDWIEVSKNAESAYRGELEKAGFKAADVKGTSFAKAVDLINSEAKRDGNFKTLAADGILNRLGDEPKYLVRIVDQPKYLRADDSKIAGKKNVWFATAEEIAGAKKNIFEVMERVGYTPKDIKDARDAIKSGKKSVSDYYLFVAEAGGTKNNGIPKWDRVVDEIRTMNAAGEADFKGFKTTDSFLKKVEDLDFEKIVRRAKQTGNTLDEYVAKLPKSKQDVILARMQIQKSFGASEMFTGEGYTRRADGQNGKMGVNELWIDNFELRSQRRNAFLPLNADAKSTKVDTVSKLATISDNPINLRGEMKTGGLMGGAVSAATTLYQVFKQPGAVDYKSAATTVAVNTIGGATLGTVSAGGERIIGRGIENALSRSNLASRGLDKLYTNPAARSFVGRLVQTEASTMTSQTFNSTLRTVGGRIGGAGIVGGLVSGGFSAYDQIGAYRRNEVTGSQAFGTIVGETTVGVGAGMAGAAAGAAVGVWFGGVGAVPGAIIGFGVGMAAGYVSDKVLRGMGVDKAIAKGVTATIDAGSRAVATIQRSAGQAVRAGRQFVGQQVREARAVYNSASSAVRSARTFVSQRVSQTRQAISSGGRAAVNYVAQAGTRAVAAVRNTATQAVNQVRSTVSNVANQVSSTVNNIANQARSTVSNAVSNVASGAVSNLRSVFGF